MLEVKIDNIVPVTEARDSFNQLVDKVESSDDMYVLTKNGKPSAILVGVHHLEKLTGTTHEELMGEIETPPHDAAPAAETIAEPVVGEAQETPLSTLPPVSPAPTPVAPTSAPLESMDNLQDSPFAYDDTPVVNTPATPTPPVTPTTTPIPSDNNPFPAQDPQSSTPQAPLNDNNPL